MRIDSIPEVSEEIQCKINLQKFEKISVNIFEKSLKKLLKKLKEKIFKKIKFEAQKPFQEFHFHPLHIMPMVKSLSVNDLTDARQNVNLLCHFR
jgi:hypothetical protein